MEMNKEWVKDPKVFQINRLDAKTSLKYYKNHKEMIHNQSSYRILLNGKWFFSCDNSLETCNENFYKEDYDCSSWQLIEVPGHLQLQGYGKPMYVNQTYPWSTKAQIIPGQLPQENQIGNYVRNIIIDEDMLKNKIEICFHGVESAFALWINGQFVGYSEDSFTPSRFDITQYAKNGINKIALQVYKYSSGSWLEDQDFWRFSGIFRDVELLLIPCLHVDDLKITTPLYDHYTRAAVEIECDFNTTSKQGEVSLALYDGLTCLGQQKLSYNKHIHCTFDIQHPKLWSSEYPHLYHLVIELYCNDKVVEIVKENIGIREFKLIDGLMCINGQRIVFHGVNRHEFCPETGRVIGYEQTKQDLLIMKDNNINALRTSHYPNQTFVYDLCDELGLYVIDEVNLETHGTWSELFDKNHILPNDNQEWVSIILDRANSMYQRDKNHPSIVMWSLGNESYGGKVLSMEADFLRSKDSTRLIHYEGIVNDRRYPTTSDIESQMYTPASDVKNFILQHPEKPFMLCEYAHAMGNSNGALYKYTDLEKELPLYQGGFIWDFVDQALYDADGQLRYGGDFKDRPSDYDFCGDGIVFANRELTPKMQEVKYCYQYINMNIDNEYINIFNSYLFTNLNQFEFHIGLYCDGKLLDSKRQVIDLSPQQSIQIHNPFQVKDDTHQYYVIIHVYDKNQHEVAHEQYLYPYHPTILPVFEEIDVFEDFLNIGVQGKDFIIRFSKTKGLTSYQIHDEELLRTIPKPHFFRPSTNNDVENQYGHRYSQWLSASLYPLVQFKQVIKQDTQCQLHFDYILPHLTNEPVHVIYSIYGNGQMDIDMNYQPSSEHIEMPVYGIMFTLYKDYNHVKYLGFGPAENYIDRNKGALFGEYEYNVQDNMTPYLYPQECGNRTNVSKIEITNGAYSLVVTGHMEFSALPYTPFEIENARHQDELPPIYQTVLCIYEKQMGVAGDNTWGAKTHNEFLLSNNQPHHLHISLQAKKS